MAEPGMAKERADLRTYPSPISTDVLFYDIVDRTLPKWASFEYGQPHWDKVRWPHHELVFVEPSKEEKRQIWWYAAKREFQDLYNTEFAQADIGGTKFDAISKTYVIHRSEYSLVTPAMGSHPPANPTPNPYENAPAFTPSDYVLAEKSVVRADQRLDSRFVVERRVYVRKVPFIQWDFDEFSGADLKTTQTLYYRGELISGTAVEDRFATNAGNYFGLQSSGIFREGKQLSANWFVVTERQILPSSFVSSGRTYTTVVDYSWPPVLEGIEIMDWLLLEGSSREYARPYYKREGYSGPCTATVTETWSLIPAALGKPETMQPLPIAYSSPFYSVSVGACLHGAIAIKADTGNSDPVWDQNVGSQRNYAATSPTDWPASIEASDENTPFRGGYLRRRIVVQRPDNPP